MKKVLVALLVVGLLMSLCACDLDFPIPDIFNLGWGDTAEPSAPEDTAAAETVETQPPLQNVLLPGPEFRQRIPQSVERIAFVHAAVPEAVKQMDLSAAGDGSVVGWISPDGLEMTVTASGGSGVLWANADCSFMFEEKHQLKEIDFSNFDTSNVVNMCGMFEECTQLTAVDVSGFDTSNVTDMNSMFAFCEDVEVLDVSAFDTSNVTDIGQMFMGCASLTVLDVSGFDTANVREMYSMFADCYSLQVLDVSGFDTSNVTDMSQMFWGSNAAVLDVSGFDTSNVTDMRAMFYGCEAVTVLDVSGFDTSKVTDMSWMFYYCESLTTLDLSNFDVSWVMDMECMFASCRNMERIYATDWTVQAKYIDAEESDGMFSGCEKLEGAVKFDPYRTGFTMANTVNGYFTKKA